MYEEYKDLAKRIRKNCLHMCYVGQGGHIGSMLSAADIMAVLYGGGFVKFDPKNPKDPDRDRFILSKGHAGAVVYGTLVEFGFFPREWMDTYYCDNGKLMGHISHYVPGVEYSTGSLGHGLNVCTGMALAAKEQGKQHKIYCMMSDGDCNEGSTWEAIMFAGQHHLENLVAFLSAYEIFQLIRSGEEHWDSGCTNRGANIVYDLSHSCDDCEDFACFLKFCQFDFFIHDEPLSVSAGLSMKYVYSGSFQCSLYA